MTVTGHSMHNIFLGRKERELLRKIITQTCIDFEKEVTNSRGITALRQVVSAFWEIEDKAERIFQLDQII